jgi:hypothetical protein
MAKVVKWALEQLLKVAPADSTINGGINYSVGNKTDAAVTAVGTTKSLMAYLKGLVQELAQRGTAKCATATYSTNTNYSDVINITDKGVLTGIYQNVGLVATTGKLKVIIDGTQLLESTTFSYVSNINGLIYPGSLAFNHRFNTSLQVQHATTASGTGESVTTIVSYTTD